MAAKQDFYREMAAYGEDYLGDDLLNVRGGGKKAAFCVNRRYFFGADQRGLWGMSGGSAAGA
jgi:hypothetical protein